MADFVYEVSCSGERGLQDAVRTWSDAVAIPAWTALPGLSAVDAYVMATSGTHDPFVDDGAGPLLLAMLHFNTAEQMSQAIAAPAFARSLEGLPQGAAITGTPFERRLYPIGGEAMPGPLTAPFSYVVRYHRPADDEAEFVSHYLADHPPLLAKLPEIRSVLCYLPLDAPATPALPTANIMIGNEVAFEFARGLQRRDGLAGSRRTARALPYISQVHRPQHALSDDAPATASIRPKARTWLNRPVPPACGTRASSTPSSRRPTSSGCKICSNSVAGPDFKFEVHGLDPPDQHFHPLTEFRCAAQTIRHALEAERAGYDAFVIGHFQEPGLLEIRGAVDIPVIGLGEANLLAALSMGRRIGLVTIDPRFIDWHERQVRAHGLDQRVVGVRAIQMDLPGFMRAFTDEASYKKVRADFVEQVRPLVAAGAEVIIPGGRSADAAVRPRVSVRDRRRARGQRYRRCGEGNGNGACALSAHRIGRQPARHLCQGVSRMH